MKNYYTQVEVAGAAQTSASYLNTCIRNGIVPAPKHQVGLRRYYDQAARDQIMRMFEDRRRAKIAMLTAKQGQAVCDAKRVEP